MTGENEKLGRDYRIVDLRRLRLFVLYPLGALCGAYGLSLWLGPAWEGFRAASARRAELAPLVDKARDLDLKYEAAAAAAGPAGTPVIWCVQNREEIAVNVDGDPAKRMKVSNYPAMPVYTGSKHQACTPMLLLLESPAAGEKVRVFFKEAF